MNIGLWILVFITWCAFLFVISGISNFRALVLKVRNLEEALEKKEEARMEAESYINEKHDELNQWSKAYDELEQMSSSTSDLFDEWIALDLPRRKYDSFKEIDDLLLQSTTKEFIRLMAWKQASEENTKQSVVNLKIQKDINLAIEDIEDKFKKIKLHFSKEGHEDINNLIEKERLRFNPL